MISLLWEFSVPSRRGDTPSAALSRPRDAGTRSHQSIQGVLRQWYQKRSSQDSKNGPSLLSSLPDELLVVITSDLNNTDLFCLKHASRRFYYLLSTTAEDLDDDGRKHFMKMTRRDKWEPGTARKLALGNSDLLISCSVCCEFHPRAAFSKTQLARASELRGCMMSERKLAVCEHTSLTLIDIRDLYLKTKQSEPKGIGCGRSPYDRIHLELYHMCFHRGKYCGDFTVTSFQKLMIIRTPDGEYGAEVTSLYELGADMPPMKDCWRHNMSVRSEATAYVNVIRKRLIRMAVQLCPHATTADHRTYTRFDINYTLATYDDLLFVESTKQPNSTWQGTCGYPDCTMRFYFRRYQYPYPRMGRTGIPERDVVKLYVIHGKNGGLPLPMNAHLLAWRLSQRRSHQTGVSSQDFERAFVKSPRLESLAP
ncbi:hypothetical protein LTR91_017876 [Friedmanniomyces endolithicus]|uniref:F-box domain-containing protein n=1 Tax=Friedmanniomyces endolithicus TaxID=329885 RepID=A0AAN6FB87_9PEZI|nr:hypothetical protein LTS00_016145 [Friedmanniomyces endolithicus]KAK0273921.1 hypothetical protein LTR35_012049 [Friedmanniomyces endolithicus]KAK0305312.1 hypothetical protein LTR01_006836 [Friedmanniomyces endolithicus]KAK0307723.1 hypothetical protein LTR82_015863 [Friedmanniomyces endolithicus]KAK0823347.1 hypothetical protein LTR73_008589 [Friedmanniomyces endolithicus]